ncbi:MAG: MBL fold metallo-hydrolase [Candidatus Nanohalobium sp.]
MIVEVLGCMQDAGVPHLECGCRVCEEARSNPEKQKYSSSLLLKENSKDSAARYLVEATPDVRYQIKGDYLDGVFIAHGRLGHLTGLLHFGEEGCNKNSLPVHVSKETENYIRKNDPFRLLIDKGNIQLEQLENGEKEELRGAKVKAFKAEHKQLNTDTMSFMVEGEEKKLFYISDIHGWTEELLEKIREADIAVVDGTFWNEEEIERYEEVPHPVMKETMHITDDWSTEIYFTHLNHTNPALRPDSEQRKELEERGFHIAERGTKFHI